MTYQTKEQTYRVQLDTQTQTFIVIDANEPAMIAYGATIEQAVKELQKSI